MGRRCAIACEGLTKRYGSVTALRSVDLVAEPGSTLALLGPNGAGKSTAVRVLCGLVKPDSGHASIDGIDVGEHPHGIRSRIGLAGQFAAVDTQLRGSENLVMIGRLRGLHRRAAHRRADELLELFDLTESAHRRAGTFSGGMRRRLDLAASLVTVPSVLFLDEPTTGLDPRGRIALWRTLEDLTSTGTTLLLTTQYMEEADRFSDTVAMLDRGSVVASGTPAQLKAQVEGDRIELTARSGDDPHSLARAVGDLGTARPDVDAAHGTVTLPAVDGPSLLPQLSTRLERAGLQIRDLHVRRPTLDDVFLALTGDTSTPPPAETSTAPDRARQSWSGLRPKVPSANPSDTGPTIATALENTATITWRNLRRLTRVPTHLALAIVQPILFVVLFSAVFGGAVDPPATEEYIDYLLPGIVVLAIGFGASQTGVALADDLHTSMIDRFRALPMSDAAVLAGRALADAARNTFVVALMIIVASAIGFRFHAGAVAATGFVALAVAIGVVLSFLNALLGMLVRDPETAGLAGLFPIIVLVFTSSTLVPVDTMPGWLQAFASVNPITVIVDALRALSLGGPTQRPVLHALAWIAALLAVAIPAAVARYRRLVAM